MPGPTDEELFDFDTSRMPNWDPERSADLLENQPELYRNHLVVARWLAGYADRLEEDEPAPVPEKVAAYALALRDIAAHLRQGDLVPGGIIFEDEVSR